MKVTRIGYSQDLNASKYEALKEQARRLGVIRSEVWQRYGSIQGVGLTDRQIRDAWLGEGRQFPVSANAWKETLRDAKADIAMAIEAAKVKARRAICAHTTHPAERRRLYTRLKRNEFTSDPILSRIMRRCWKRGHNHTHNQIIVRSDSYTTFQLGGRAWIRIPGLERGKRIAIPLNTTVEPAGTLRIILRDGRVEVHYAVDVAPTNDCGTATLGVAKGHSGVLVDSLGEHHGNGLGERLSSESAALKVTYQRRSKLRTLANKTRNTHKRHNIHRHNLGYQKLRRRADRTRANLRDVVFKSVHAVVDKAAVIASKDLSAPTSGECFDKSVNRRLASWTKGVIAEALDTVSQRRGSTLVFVNPAYTSQVDHRNGTLMGRCVGDSFYCFDGVVFQADENAALNVQARLHDPEIDRWTPYQEVKAILLERTERLRLGLLNQDSSCRPRGLSTESEMLENCNAQSCVVF